MRRVATFLLVGALVTLILQPVTLNVNTQLGNAVLQADGGPMPPFPPPTPPKTTLGNLVTDGGPMPPFPPTPPTSWLA